MDRDRIHAAITQERRCIADLIDGLDEAQLATASLCEGWDVKTVGAHLMSFLAEGTLRVTWLGVRRRSEDRAIDEMARRTAQLPAAEIAATLASSLSKPTGGPHRKHLVCWPRSCPIAATSESRLGFPSNPTCS